MNYKKYIAAVMALSMATGVAGCGSQRTIFLQQRTLR